MRSSRNGDGTPRRGRTHVRSTWKNKARNQCDVLGNWGGGGRWKSRNATGWDVSAGGWQDSSKARYMAHHQHITQSVVPADLSNSYASLALVGQCAIINGIGSTEEAAWRLAAGRLGLLVCPTPAAIMQTLGLTSVLLTNFHIGRSHQWGKMGSSQSVTFVTNEVFIMLISMDHRVFIRHGRYLAVDWYRSCHVCETTCSIDEHPWCRSTEQTTSMSFQAKQTKSFLEIRRRLVPWTATRTRCTRSSPWHDVPQPRMPALERDTECS
jgi:hypothetical protein